MVGRRGVVGLHCIARTPSANHHSPLTTHHSPLTTHHPPLRRDAVSMSETLYPAELFADQSRRWRQGERLAVEVYLEQWPSLRQSPNMVLDLICNEIILR